MMQLHNMMKSIHRSLAVPLLVSLLAISGTAIADTGFYIGGSVGDTTLQADFDDPIGDGTFSFDESDFSWKAFGGINFDLPVIQLGIEAGYVDLGGPSATFASEEYGVDVTAWDAFGVAGFNLGPVKLFGKLGVISWDAEATIAGIEAGSDDGTDTAYGVGAALELGSFQIRAEYEAFDISDVEDLYMLSAGFVYTF